MAVSDCTHTEWFQGRTYQKRNQNISDITLSAGHSVWANPNGRVAIALYVLQVCDRGCCGEAACPKGGVEAVQYLIWVVLKESEEEIGE